MRLIKMFVLALVVTLAFIGAPSASATDTVLCKINELVCPEGQEYSYTGAEITGHVEALAENVKLKGGLSVTCKHSTILGEALDPLKGEPLVIHVTLLDFPECNCTVSVNDQTGLITVSKTASNLAGGSAEGFEVKVTCFGVSCVYGGVAEGAHGLGGEPATIVLTEVELKLLSGSKLCGEKPGLVSATYEAILPKPIYIAETVGGSTVLCEVNDLVCPAKGQEHVEALTTHALLKGAVNITCNHSVILGEALGLANPLIIHVTLLDFKECSSKLCKVEVLDQTGLISVLKTASNLAGGSAEGFEVKVACFGISCTYGGTAQGTHGLGSANSTSDATLVANEVELQLLSGSSILCGEKPGLWTATYNVTSPLPIYISE